MANAGSFALVEGAPSTIANPAAGNAVVGVDASNHAFTLNSAGNIWIPNLNTAITAASAAINNVETIISNVLTLPVGLLQAGTTLRFIVGGTCTSTVANNSTFTIRLGTLGTTGDASVATWVLAAATSGTNVPFYAEIVYTIRTTGAPGTGYGLLGLTNTGTTGIFTVAGDALIPTGNTGPNTSTGTKLSLTYVTAATTTTSTIQICTAEILAV